MTQNAKQNQTGVVILAAGSGSRMGGGLPKQFRMLDGKPMYLRSLAPFVEDEAVSRIVLVADAAHVDAVREELAEAAPRVTVATGGATRAESVRNGLAALPSDVRYVLVHDGARPYVTPEVIGRVEDAMFRTGAAIPCVPPKDTIRTAEETLDRSKLYAVQTPQGFRRDILEQAYEEAAASGFEGTDDASYVENLGIRVTLCEGDPANTKITTPDDMPAGFRVGTGFDVHRFGNAGDAGDAGGQSGTHITIGGVAIPYERPLLAHSDGDVLTHAIMDALLGAAGLPDIGQLFPDSDPAYKDADSIALLAEVGRRLAAEGYRVVNVDSTLMGQEPKFAPYEPAMRGNIAAALGLAPGAVNVKATTTEGLGFTGRKEGLAAQAMCLLARE